MDQLNAVFPLALKLINMNYAIQIFQYIKRRKDNDIENQGEQILRCMQQFRSVPDENNQLYYDILASLITKLFKYAQLEEQVSKSGFYEGQRLQLLNNIKATLLEFEKQNDIIEYLHSLLSTKNTIKQEEL